VKTGYPVDPEEQLAGLMKREGDQTSVTLDGIFFFLSLSHHEVEWAVVDPATASARSVAFAHSGICFSGTAWPKQSSSRHRLKYGQHNYDHGSPAYDRRLNQYTILKMRWSSFWPRAKHLNAVPTMFGVKLNHLAAAAYLWGSGQSLGLAYNKCQRGSVLSGDHLGRVFAQQPKCYVKES
jgi:hypothetical protein